MPSKDLGDESSNRTLVVYDEDRLLILFYLTERCRFRLCERGRFAGGDCGSEQDARP
jgi:hypothetical protein